MPIQPASLIKNPNPGTQAATGGKASSSDSASEGGKKGDGAPVTEVRAINMSRNVTAVSAQSLIAPGRCGVQSHSHHLDAVNVPVAFRTLQNAQMSPFCNYRCKIINIGTPLEVIKWGIAEHNR